MGPGPSGSSKMWAMPDGTSSTDDAQLAALARSLADGIVDALPGWVEACVDRLATAWAGSVAGPVAEAARVAGRQAATEVGPAVRALLAQDVDDQRTTPLALVRDAVRYPTEVLRAAGVPPVVRDELAESAFPADDYDLSPGAFADLDPELAEVGLAWGAAKAYVVLARRKGRP